MDPGLEQDDERADSDQSEHVGDAAEEGPVAPPAVPIPTTARESTPIASAMANAARIDHTCAPASTNTRVAGTAAVTIDHERRSSPRTSALWTSRCCHDRLVTRRETVWANQMATALTMTTPAVVSSPGCDSKVRPATATSVAMVP